MSRRALWTRLACPGALSDLRPGGETRGLSTVGDELGAGREAGLVAGEIHDQVRQLLGRPSRRIATCFCGASMPAVIGVATAPGCTELQRMSCAPRSRATDLVKPRTPNFRGAVPGKLAVSLDPGGRGDVDDRAGCCRFQRIERGVDPIERAGQVDGDDRVPLLGRASPIAPVGQFRRC